MEFKKLVVISIVLLVIIKFNEAIEPERPVCVFIWKNCHIVDNKDKEFVQKLGESNVTIWQQYKKKTIFELVMRYFGFCCI